MIAPDVNILLYAFREDSPRHNEYRSWLAEVLIGEEPVALFEPVLAAVLRIATHPAIYRTPAPREAVEKYIAALRAAPAAVLLRAGERHWNLFVDFCRKADCHGNMVQDAYLAALALEHGCAWITSDRDFARFPQLVWRHPLDHPRG
jgi:toxin-antitoxin system PIN domain toxin